MIPVNDRVIIEPFKIEGDTEKSGIIIPDTAKPTPQEGKVLAVGPGKPGPTSSGYIPMQVSVGDHVLYGKYAGTEVCINDQTILIMNESDILVITKKHEQDIGS